MSDDFQVGDLAICVLALPPLRQGAIYRIAQVLELRGEAGVNVREIDVISLGYVGIKASRFRKLPKADEQFTQSMRALKPHKVEEPA